MRKVSQSGKSKSSIVFLKIFLASLICILSLLDAPEYVHCTHKGVCEFLEVYGNLKPSQEAEKILTRIKRVINQYSSHLYPFIEYYSCRPKRYGDLYFSQICFQNVGLSEPFYILSQYINPDCKKFFHLPLKKGDKISVNQEHIFPSIRNYLTSQTLQIISISIINS